MLCIWTLSTHIPILLWIKFVFAVPAAAASAPQMHVSLLLLGRTDVVPGAYQDLTAALSAGLVSANMSVAAVKVSSTAKELPAAAAALPAPRLCVGHSMTGGAAELQEWVATSPGACAGLVLLNGFLTRMQRPDGGCAARRLRALGVACAACTVRACEVPSE